MIVVSYINMLKLTEVSFARTLVPVVLVTVDYKSLRIISLVE